MDESCDKPREWLRAVMVLPDDWDEMVGRSSGVEGVERGSWLGLAVVAEDEWAEVAVGGGVCSCVWEVCVSGWATVIGVSWSSSSSGLAMRRPPSERDRLKSPFMLCLNDASSETRDGAKPRPDTTRRESESESGGEICGVSEEMVVFGGVCYSRHEGRHNLLDRRLRLCIHAGTGPTGNRTGAKVNFQVDNLRSSRAPYEGCTGPREASHTCQACCSSLQHAQQRPRQFVSRRLYSCRSNDSRAVARTSCLLSCPPCMSVLPFPAPP